MRASTPVTFLGALSSRWSWLNAKISSTQPSKSHTQVVCDRSHHAKFLVLVVWNNLLQEKISGILSHFLSSDVWEIISVMLSAINRNQKWNLTLQLTWELLWTALANGKTVIESSDRSKNKHAVILGESFDRFISRVVFDELISVGYRLLIGLDGWHGGNQTSTCQLKDSE